MNYCAMERGLKCVLCWEVVPFLEGSFVRVCLPLSTNQAVHSYSVAASTKSEMMEVIHLAKEANVI